MVDHLWDHLWDHLGDHSRAPPPGDRRHCSSPGLHGDQLVSQTRLATSGRTHRVPRSRILTDCFVSVHCLVRLVAVPSCVCAVRAVRPSLLPLVPALATTFPPCRRGDSVIRISCRWTCPTTLPRVGILHHRDDGSANALSTRVTRSGIFRLDGGAPGDFFPDSISFCRRLREVLVTRSRSRPLLSPGQSPPRGRRAERSPRRRSATGFWRIAW